MIISTDFSWSCRAISHIGAGHPVTGPSGAAQDAESATLAESSDDSSDSYNGDDARHYLHERNEAMDRYSEATRENWRLELALSASQAALAAVEGEIGAVRAKLAESDARIAGKIFNKTLSLGRLCFVDLFLMISFYLL